MQHFFLCLGRLRNDSCISVVIIATVNAIGVNLNAKFNSVSTQLK
jgi:hypothetical protein